MGDDVELCGSLVLRLVKVYQGVDLTGTGVVVGFTVVVEVFVVRNNGTVTDTFGIGVVAVSLCHQEAVVNLYELLVEVVGDEGDIKGVFDNGILNALFVVFSGLIEMGDSYEVVVLLNFSDISRVTVVIDLCVVDSVAGGLVGLVV